MNTMVMKMKKNKKGFTLIELIVVIAILAILALIAIPRFAGFTDKAKVRADDQYIALYTNAITVLLAEGKITGLGGTNTVVLAADGTPTVTGLTGANAANFTSLVKTTSFKYFTSGVTITVNNMQGGVTITYTTISHPDYGASRVIS